MFRKLVPLFEIQSLNFKRSSSYPKHPSCHLQVVLGATGLFDGLSKGNMWIDHTTSSYEQTIELTGEASKRGFRPVECCLSGGIP